MAIQRFMSVDLQTQLRHQAYGMTEYEYLMESEDLRDAAAKRIDLLEAERDAYLTRETEINILRQRNEVRAIFAEERVDQLETALRAIDGVPGPYDDGYVEEIKKILARSLGGNGVAGNEGADQKTGDPAASTARSVEVAADRIRKVIVAQYASKHDCDQAWDDLEMLMVVIASRHSFVTTDELGSSPSSEPGGSS